MSVFTLFTAYVLIRDELVSIERERGSLRSAFEANDPLARRWRHRYGQACHIERVLRMRLERANC
jgi:hypothetical protein